MNGSEALHRAGIEFANRLKLVGTNDWELATPCDEWAVRDLVNHVVGGNFRYAMILQNEEPSAVLATHSLDFLGADPVAAFRSGFQQVTEAFDEPGALTATVHHPKSGKMSGAHLRVLRVDELAVHSWDLARAICVDDSLDNELVRWLFDRLGPIQDTIAKSGLYAPPVPLEEADESFQTRLLHLLGRRR
jgi:uncharacterized protein (TIGR03086 family)